MKKLFSLALVLFAMLFAANAQVTVILEAHDVWGDGSGYQLLLDADHNTYGTTIPATGGLTSSGDASASVYAEFEYKIPANADGSLTTQNIVFDGSVSITIPAGTYDYCITNPTPGDRMWIASNNGTQPGRADDFVFEDGHIYHFLVGRVGSNDGITLTVSMIPTGPTIDAPAAVNFGTVLLNNSATRTANVNAYLLTNSITATTAAPFEISTNGTTFGTTATLDTTGGALYIKYTPTAAGNHNGSVILSSVGASNDTIILTGSCIDCSNITLPYSCDFTDAAQYDCWTIVDANNDGTTFTLASGAASYSYSSSSAADDYLISPSFAFTGAQTATFDYKSASATYPEIFEVFAIGADTVRLTQPETVTSTTYLTKTLDLSNLNGNYSIAIHCISAADMFRLSITNFSVFGSSMAIVNVNPNTLAFSTIPAGASENSTFTINTTNLNEAITIATAAPFSVSLDGTTFNTTVTVPADTTFITSTPVYVRFAPTAAGTFNGEVVVSTTTTADTISLSGTAIECNAITTFPFTEDFATTSATLTCWQVVDNNNDGSTFSLSDGTATYVYNGSNSADDYLISPEITVNSALYGHIDYAAYSASYPEKFSIYVIPENGTIATAVNVVPTVTVDNTDFMTQPFDLSAYTNQTIRVAIKAESDANMWRLIFDNFTIEAMPTTDTLSVDPTSMSFITTVGSTSDAQSATVEGLMLANDITVTTAAPFEVSADGTTFGATATIPGGNIVNATLYVRYAPTTPGTQTGTATLTSGSRTVTINLSGEGVDCSTGIASLPYTHDFNDAVIPPFCWGYGTASNFLRLNVDEEAGDFGIAIGQPDYLMTPEIHSTTNMNISFDYSTYGGAQASSSFRVGYSSNDNISNFTWLETVTVAEDITGFNRYSANIPSGTKYIAIQATEIGSFTYFIYQYPNYVLLDNIAIAEGDGIDDITNTVSIYPNPANNSVNVNAASNINMIEVFNMMGQRVAAYDANDTNVQINTTALNNGMYMMRITTENGVSNQKLMIAR